MVYERICSLPSFFISQSCNKICIFYDKKTNKRKKKWKEQSMCDTSNVKCSNIHIIGTTQWEEKENRQKKYWRDNIWGFFKMNETPDWKRSANSEEDKYKWNHNLAHLPNCQTAKKKKKKQSEIKEKLPSKYQLTTDFSRENRRQWNGL